MEGIIAESGKHPNYFLEQNKIQDYEEVIFKGIKEIGKYFEEIVFCKLNNSRKLIVTVISEDERRDFYRIKDTVGLTYTICVGEDAIPDEEAFLLKFPTSSN